MTFKNSPTFAELGPRTTEARLQGGFRSRLYALLTAGTMAAGLVACSDDETEAPAPKSWSCVNILDQTGSPMFMEDCITDYEAPAEGQALNNCDDDEQLFVYEAPGEHKINAKCGKLAGYIQIPLKKEGDNGTYESRLVDSICYNDEYRIILDPDHKTKDLSETMGHSTDTRCANWFTGTDARKAEISAITLQCDENDSNCTPENGRDYLKVLGVNGQYMYDKPLHLTVEASPEKVPVGEEVTVRVTIRDIFGAEQEIDVPVVVKNSDSNGAGGSGGGIAN